MDLKSANKAQESNAPGQSNGSISGGEMPASGFGGLSKRNEARKPVIAAVNGFALGTCPCTKQKNRSDLNLIPLRRRRHRNRTGLRYCCSHSKIHFRSSRSQAWCHCCYGWYCSRCENHWISACL
jgi:hypothetical protein